MDTGFSTNVGRIVGDDRSNDGAEMRVEHRLPGLHETSLSEVPEGLYLVRVERAKCGWARAEAFYTIRFTVLEPKALASAFSSRLYCTKKTLLKVELVQPDNTVPQRLSVLPAHTGIPPQPVQMPLYCLID